VAKLIYSAISSLDGYVADEEGNFDWAAPDEEVHQFFNDHERGVGTHLYGRRMYETMVYWETAHKRGSAQALNGQPYVAAVLRLLKRLAVRPRSAVVDQPTSSDCWAWMRWYRRMSCVRASGSSRVSGSILPRDSGTGTSTPSSLQMASSTFLVSSRSA
jgi:hypothetical protein